MDSAQDLSVAANAALLPEIALDEPSVSSTVKPEAPSTIQPTTQAAEATEANIDAAIAQPENGAQDNGCESSDLEGSSDDDSDSSSSSSDGEKEGTEKSEKVHSAFKDGDMDEDDDEDKATKTANEITNVYIERPEFVVSETTPLYIIGEIFRIIDNVIVVKSGRGTKVVDMGTLFVYEDREIMGEVFETFGPVAQPFYSIRYNTSAEMDNARAKPGAAVYYVPSYRNTRLVDTEEIKRIKGTDASNRFDEEVDESELEFSDDEQEMWHKRKQKQEKKRKRMSETQSGSSNALPDYNTAQRRSLQSYADLDETPYYKQSMPRRPPVQESSELWWAPSEPSQSRQTAQSLQAQPSQAAPQTAPQESRQPVAMDATQETSPTTPSGSSYQSPAQLVSALFSSYGGRLPTIQSVRSLFSTPPPPASQQDEEE